ncbi:glycoside hydrolase family 30 protein [Thermoactinospora rubra]|uniref:glycoside hydrolase family 30 protein n=1 Tax=Thermoactinospora rubra TaxID=1088767 RepID=UPI000A11C2D6|nr:glycoside hydrolase family 30 beta sandwich domain-containing protein [Thermoactinospora rubra]
MTRSRVVLLAGVLALPLLAAPAQAASATVTVDYGKILRRIDGLGFAQPFRRNELVLALPERQQQEILDLWLSRDKGAGASILRFGIGSSPAGAPYDQMVSIQPEDPGGPDAPPKYVWDGQDNAQVWLAKIAKERYGVDRFFFDAWSAPGYMKDNGTDSGGGTLCGLSGTSCAGGDWRRAYARYLIDYTRFYRREGIKITDLGFTNEPDYTATYASMRFTPEQAVEFIKIIGPMAGKEGVKLVCCDSFGWTEAKAYTAAIEADPEARRLVKVHTGHTYASPIDSPLPTDRPTWMSEMTPNGNTWNENWDDGSGYDGWWMANHIHDSFALGNVSAYVSWFGASRGATRAFLQIDEVNKTYRVSKRLWAFAAYSRFIRPGAVRVEAASADPALKVTAFRNPDGSRVIEIINTAATAVQAEVPGHGRRATAYVTDTTRSLERADILRGHGAALTADLPPRSLTTIVIPGRH